MKRGIIQARGLGDIIIALPIARYYHQQGDSIYWPICQEFMSSFEKSVPWVNWIAVETDSQGLFFYDRPLELLKEAGVAEDDCLYLYQFLSSQPELTDAEMFAILKFDQYKYWAAGVPFINKWSLSECITRDAKREQALKRKLKISGDYAVVHLTGSNCRANLDLSWLENLAIINVDEHLTDCVFDWLLVLEEAQAFVGIDSVFANLVDSMQLPIPDKYWMRRSSWDLTPVLGGSWSMIDNAENLTDPQRVVIGDLVRAKEAARREASRPTQAGAGGALWSSVPFQTQQTYPQNFMSAVQG